MERHEEIFFAKKQIEALVRAAEALESIAKSQEKIAQMYQSVFSIFSNKKNENFTLSFEREYREER